MHWLVKDLWAMIVLEEASCVVEDPPGAGFVADHLGAAQDRFLCESP